MKWKLMLAVAASLAVGFTSFVLSSPGVRHSLARLATGDPAIELPSEINVGERELGEEVQVPLTIRNAGRGDLVVDSIQSSCSCSGLERVENGAVVTVERLRLSGGQREQLTVRVAVRGVPGQSKKSTLILHTNDPDLPEARLDIVIPTILGGVLALPNNVVFGAVPISSAASQDVDVWDPAPTPRILKVVTSSRPEAFSTELVPLPGQRPPTRAKQGVLIGRVRVTCLAREPGSVSGEVYVELAGERPGRSSIFVSARVASPLVVAPPALVLPRSSGSGALLFGNCLICTSDGRPLHASILRADPGLLAELRPAGSDPAAVTLRVEIDRRFDWRRVGTARRTVTVKARVGNSDTTVEVPVAYRPPAGGGGG
jgi:hypothetical protein